MPQADVDYVALTAFYLAPPVLPEVPAADASTFNDKVFRISNKLNERLAANSKEFYQELAMGLEYHLGRTVVYGDSLGVTDQYDRLKQKEDLYGLQISDQPKFPKVHLGEGGLNIFDFENGEIQPYLKSSPRVRSSVRNAVKGLDCEVIAIGHGRVVVDKVTRFGEYANLRLLLDVYLYNEKGDLAGHAYGETKPIRITGASVSEFNQLFDQYETLQTDVLTALTTVESEEE